MSGMKSSDLVILLVSALALAHGAKFVRGSTAYFDMFNLSFLRVLFTVTYYSNLRESLPRTCWYFQHLLSSWLKTCTLIHCDGMSQITVIYGIQCRPNSAQKKQTLGKGQATTTTKVIILRTAVMFSSVIRINVAKFSPVFSKVAIIISPSFSPYTNVS